MSAPGGLCEFCGGVLEWTFFDGEMWTSCPWCFDVFEAGPVVARREGASRGARRDEDSLKSASGVLPDSLRLRR